MNRNVAVRLLALTLSTSMAVSVMAGPARKASGEIIGIVESGSSRVPGAVVSLVDVTGSFSPPSTAVEMNQKDKEFEPHVLAILKGTKVKFSNDDPFFHNVYSSSRVKMFNVSQEKKGDTSIVTFEKAGLVPIKCHIHAAMKAYIVVLGNPYFDTTNSKGQFRITDVPAGTYSVKVWSEKGSPENQTVEVTSGGRAKLIVKI